MADREDKMGLFLIRHGDANPKSVDPSRSLSPRGVEEASTLASFLSSLRVKPDCMFSSDKKRALMTATIIASALKFDEERIIVSENLSPAANPGDLGRFISSHDPKGTIIVVGHLPSIGNLTSYLITPERDTFVAIEFDTCGVAYLEGDDVAEPGGFVLKILISPALI